MGWWVNASESRGLCAALPCKASKGRFHCANAYSTCCSRSAKAAAKSNQLRVRRVAGRWTLTAQCCLFCSLQDVAAKAHRSCPDAYLQAARRGDRAKVGGTLC